MLSRKYQTAKIRRDLHKPITTSLRKGQVASALLDRACYLLSDWLAQLAVWALIGWQTWLPELWLVGRDHCLGVSAFSVNKPSCSVAICLSCPLRLLLLPPPQQGTGIHRRRSPSFYSKSKGPWLYGDGEAHTEYVQNDFYKQSWKTPVWCRVLLARAIHRKLRFSFAFRKQPSFLVQRLRTSRSWLSSTTSSSSSWTHAGVVFAPEKLSYTTQLCGSSQQKWMKNAVPVTPGHENSEALLKQTH